MTAPRTTRLCVNVDLDLLDSVDVEAEILTVGRAFIVRDALRLWLRTRIEQQTGVFR